MLTFWRRSGKAENLHYSEVLTQANEAPRAQGETFREGGNLHNSEDSAKLRGKAGIANMLDFRRRSTKRRPRGGYVSGKAGDY